MSGFSIDITGDLNKRLDEMTAEVKQVLRDELNEFGLETVGMAKNLCPVDEGTLRNMITFSNISEPAIGVEFSVASPYAAYIEFGTGLFAAAYVPSLPPSLQEYAMTFFVNGKGRIPARPYLFPAIEANTVLLMQRLKAQLG